VSWSVRVQGRMLDGHVGEKPAVQLLPGPKKPARGGPCHSRCGARRPRFYLVDNLLNHACFSDSIRTGRQHRRNGRWTIDSARDQSPKATGTAEGSGSTGGRGLAPRSGRSTHRSQNDSVKRLNGTNPPPAQAVARGPGRGRGLGKNGFFQKKSQAAQHSDPPPPISTASSTGPRAG